MTRRTRWNFLTKKDQWSNVTAHQQGSLTFPDLLLNTTKIWLQNEQNFRNVSWNCTWWVSQRFFLMVGFKPFKFKGALHHFTHGDQCTCPTQHVWEQLHHVLWLWREFSEAGENNPNDGIRVILAWLETGLHTTNVRRGLKKVGI